MILRRQSPPFAVVVLALVATGLAGAALSACGDDDDGNVGPGDGGGPDGSRDSASDTNHSEHDAGPKDAEAPKIRCSSAELAQGDFSDGGAVEITFNTGANPTQYTNHCVTVKAGASVTFSGSFFQHPLEPAGGDEPTPIPKLNKEPDGGKLVVTFPSPGTFGYQCTFHPTSMFGAIRVVP